MRHKGTEAQRHKVKIKNSGQLLVAAILGMLVLLIIVPAFVQFVSNESRWTVKEKKSSTAFHLAEAGLDRGFWKLQENASVWAALTSGAITNYNFDKIYADISGGQYKVKLSSHPTNSQYRVITAMGRDSANTEVRTIQATYQRQTLDSAIWTGGEAEIEGNSEVHWGPVKSQQEIDLNGSAASNLFPRKYARLEIDPRDTSSSAPNTDNVEWWSFYDVPPRPVIDFDAIRSSAIANGTCFGGNDADCPGDDQDWTNAYPGSNHASFGGTAVSNMFDDNLYWFFRQRLRLSGQTYIYGTIIVDTEELDLDGSGDGEYITTPPSEAWREYAKMDTAAADQWFGDAGGGPPSSVSASFEFRDGGAPLAPRNGINKGVSLRGFVYAKEELEGSGNNVIHGSIITDDDDVEINGTLIVFYDPNIQNVPILNTTIQRIEWRELQSSW